MHAVRAAGQRDIGAIVHQDFRSVRIGKLEHAPDETRQFTRGQIFFADLNALDARRERRAIFATSSVHVRPAGLRSVM